MTYGELIFFTILVLKRCILHFSPIIMLKNKPLPTMALKNGFTLFLCVMAVQFPVYAGLTPSITKYVPEEQTASTPTSKALALQNLQRSIAFVDLTIEKYFDAETFAMHRYYNPFNQERSKERASVWMYTAGIESVNAILHALKVARDQGYTQEYDLHYSRYVQLFEKLYQEADYYLGTFELTSYTQTKVWSNQSCQVHLL